MFRLILAHPFTRGLIVFYTLILLWWLKINLISHSQDTMEAYLYNFVYGYLPLAVGIFALMTAYQKWNGSRSLLGKGLIGIKVDPNVKTVSG